MRKGFTLVELLIVVVVIVTLMAITFRLSGIGSETRKRNSTVARMQRVENALSGYFAAFGSYPPVPLQGRSRNIYERVNDHGIQYGEENRLNLSDASDESARRIQEQVEAACRSQPVAALYPINRKYGNVVKARSAFFKDLASSGSSTQYSDINSHREVYSAGFDALDDNPGRMNAYLDKTDWNTIQLFQFGLMSFILPRYLFMLDGAYSEYYDRCAQWKANNTLPARFDNGQQYSSWEKVQQDIGSGRYSDGGGNARAQGISNLTSQAACARWIPNLEGTVSSMWSELWFYGVNVARGDNGETIIGFRRIFSPGSQSGNSYSQQYTLDFMTVNDGWERELYYYSPPPYQSYRLWSAGADGKTFPPWIDLKSLNSADRQVAAKWISDDIVHMSN